MLEKLAKILGRHTADILSEVAGSEPEGVLFSGLAPQEELPVCELAVSIDFGGFLAEERREIGGYLLCGAVRGAEIRPLLKAVADHLGLDPAVLETKDGPQNILDELLNIIIGLTGADWAEHGFEIKFSPPHVLSGRALPSLGSGDQAFHLFITFPAEIQVDIVIVFHDQNRRNILS